MAGQGCSYQESPQRRKKQPQNPNSSKCTSFSAVQTQQETPSPGGAAVEGAGQRQKSVTQPPQRPGRAARPLSPWDNCAIATSRVMTRKLPQKGAEGSVTSSHGGLSEGTQVSTAKLVVAAGPGTGETGGRWGHTASANRDHPNLEVSLSPGWERERPSRG